MNAQEFIAKRPYFPRTISTPKSKRKQLDLLQKIQLVALVVLISFAIGFIPIIFAATLPQ